MSHQTPIPEKNVQFDPAEMVTLTIQDRNALAPRYNERLQVAVQAGDKGPRTIVYIGQANSFMRILSAARVGESDRWMVTQNSTINFDPPAELPDAENPLSDMFSAGKRRSAVANVKNASGAQFMCAPFPESITMDQFSSRYGRTFAPAE